LRKQLETQWAEEFKAVEGKTRGDAILEYMKASGLSDSEIKQSRSYFPKLQVSNADKKPKEVAEAKSIEEQFSSMGAASGDRNKVPPPPAGRGGPPASGKAVASQPLN